MILNPWGFDYMDSVAEKAVGPYLHPRTDLVCTNLGKEALPMPWPVPESRKLAVERAMKAQADGFDAIVIGCCADPFLSDIRQAVSIPVVGVTEAACATARSRGKITIMARRLSDSFRSLIPIQNAWERGWTDLATGYGLKPGEFSLRRVFVPGHPDPETLVDLTNRDQAKLRDLTVAGMSEALHAEGLEQTRAAIKEDGARAVYFACAFWSLPISELEKAGNAFGVPVINPLVSAVSYAEHLLLSGRPVQASALV